MLKEELKERMDSEEFEGWKAWFHYPDVRTPEDELNDIFQARALAVKINSVKTKGWPVEPRDLLIFKPPVTEEEIKLRTKAASQKMRSALSAVRKKRRR